VAQRCCKLQHITHRASPAVTCSSNRTSGGSNGSSSGSSSGDDDDDDDDGLRGIAPLSPVGMYLFFSIVTIFY